jgi:hypothetical protein
MKKIALTAVAAAALSLGACQAGTSNNSANAHGNASGNLSANASHNASGEAGHSNVSTVVNNGLQGAGNLASQAGDVIENGARATVNGVKEVGRDLSDGPDNAPAANKTGN